MECGRNRYKNKRVCEALTQKYGLALPKQKYPNLEKLHGLERAKAEIKIAASEAQQSSRNWNEFAALLARKNIHIIPKYRRGTTEMQGVSFQLGDYKVKGSDVGEQFKFKILDRYFNSQSQQSRPKQSRQSGGYQQQTAASSAVSTMAQGAANTLAMAAEITADIGETMGGLTSGLFQPGSGHLDENESLEAWKLTHPKKKKRKTQKL